MYYIFSFRQRAESISFFDLLKKQRVQGKLVNTPRQVSIGCGLSVKISTLDFSFVKDFYLKNKAKFASFLGIYYYNGQILSPCK